MNLMTLPNEVNYELFDPLKFRNNVDINYTTVPLLKENLKSMLIIRYAEEKISEMVVNGIIKCPCHLGIGQEAVAVGVSSFVKKSDSVFGAHRSHSHFLALNNNVFELFAETLGRVDGCSKGMGGSMHLIDKNNGFYGSVPIVGATIPIAVGAGFAHKFDKKRGMSVSYLGDGATEEGVFHESLNLAKVNNLPVLFVVENNLFASHMHILERQPNISTLRYSKAHNIDSLLVDGNDISAVHNAAKTASDFIRNGNGPFMLECVTYRWKGHVGPSDDNDVGLQRSEVLNEWKMRDPIKRLTEGMIKNELIDESELVIIEKAVRDIINNSWEDAVKSPFPESDFLFQTVYSR
jgi:TPP-dependent pyruvate/acetoin dehydrogenase alpha subunit